MSVSSPLTVLVCDDHPIVLEGLSVIIKQVPDFQLLNTCSSGKELMEAVNSLQPNIILVDANLKEENGYQLVAQIRNQQQETNYHPTLIIITSYMDDFSTDKAKNHGAHGFLSKSISAEDLVTKIKDYHYKNIQEIQENKVEIQMPFPHYPQHGISMGEKRNSNAYLTENLTKRELTIIQELITGKPTKTLADALFISPYTLETHKKNIFRKLKVNSVGELIAWFHKQNIPIQSSQHSSDNR